MRRVFSEALDRGNRVPDNTAIQCRYPSGIGWRERRRVGSQAQTFYRVAKAVPPANDEYQTKREKDGPPKPNASLEVAAAYDGLTAFDTAERARAKGQRFPALGTKI